MYRTIGLEIRSLAQSYRKTGNSLPEIEEDPTVPNRTSTKYPEVRPSMQYLFDDNLAVFFQKVLKKSFIEFKEHDLTMFQKMLRDGMNNICGTFQKSYLNA